MRRLVAFGDSTTHCVGKSGVSEATCWRALLAREAPRRLGTPLEVLDAGVNADIAPLALQRLDRDILAHEPDTVTVMFGTNDAGYFRPPNGVADTPRVPLDEFQAVLGEILDRLMAGGTETVVCTSVPMSRHYWLADLPPYVEHGLNYLVKDYAAAVRQLADARGLPVADVQGAFFAHPHFHDLVPDGVHPNAAGQRLIASTLLNVLDGPWRYIADRPESKGPRP